MRHLPSLLRGNFLSTIAVSFSKHACHGRNPRGIRRGCIRQALGSVGRGWAQVGSGRSLGEANLFAPLWQNRDTLIFADIRAMFDSKDAAEGNFGLGVRRILPSGWNVGAYGYYDVRPVRPTATASSR